MMKKTVFILLLWLGLLIMFQTQAYSQDSIRQNQIVFNGYLKDMQTAIFSDIHADWTNANLIHNRLNFKWLVSPAIAGSVEIRNRFLSGNILTGFPGYNKLMEKDRGFLQLSANIIDEKTYLLNVAIDRLWFAYTAEKLQVSVGRQRINWGQTFVWNPNDIFNSYSYFDFDYEERPGSDAVRVQYYPGATSVIEFAAKINDQKKTTLAGLYRFNTLNYDFQIIGGMVDQHDFVVGSGWSGQILKGGFRGEASYFHPMRKMSDTTGILLVSVGYDYSFKNSLFIQCEVLYSGNKQSSNDFSPEQISSSNQDTKNLFLPDYTIFSAVSYPLNPILNGSLAGMYNPKSNLLFIIPTVNISLSNNIELSFTGQLIRFFSSKTDNTDLNFIYARIKGSF